jgi:hypothetical protein
VANGYPSWLGEWPALAGYLLLFGVLEQLTTVPTSPRLTAVVLAGYAGVMLGGAVAFGPTWLRRADPLGVLYRLLGRVAPVTVTREAGTATLRLVAPWRGCRRPVETLALAVFVIVTTYTVSFDGVTSTRVYQALVVRAADTNGAVTLVVVYALGLAAYLATFLAICGLSDRLGRDGADGSWRAAARAFAPTVLPIAAAFELAHNYPSVLRKLGRLWPVAASRVGATADPLQLHGWLSVPVFWWSQVVLIVGGHVVAVVAAHPVTRARYHTGRAARRAHVPLVVLMVASTILSVWIVSQPVVR